VGYDASACWKRGQAVGLAGVCHQVIFSPPYLQKPIIKHLSFAFFVHDFYRFKTNILPYILRINFHSTNLCFYGLDPHNDIKMIKMLITFEVL
jgi:hypothetical protein